MSEGPGAGVPWEKEEKKLKKLFKGEVLVGYVEAARVKPLTEWMEKPLPKVEMRPVWPPTAFETTAVPALEKFEKVEPLPPRPKHRLENWYVLAVPNRWFKYYRWNYQFQGSWDVKDFNTLDELNAVVSKGAGEIYLHAFRQKALAEWEPATVPEPTKIAGEERHSNGKVYTLVQPIFESVPKKWYWRVSVWNKETNESEPEFQMTEEDFDKIQPPMYMGGRNAIHKLFWLPSPRGLPALWSEITIEGKPTVRGYREIRAAPKEAIVKEIFDYEKAQIIEANYPWTPLNVEYPTSIEKIIETIPVALLKASGLNV